MGLFVKQGHPANEEDYEALVSILPGYSGPGNKGYTGADALLNSDIFTAIMMIASDLARMDIIVKKDNVHDSDHPIEILLNKKPNNIYDGYTFKLAVFASALLTKHGYVEIVRDDRGQPKELYHLKTSEVQLKKDNNKVYYRHKEKRKLNYEDVIDYKPYTLDGINGLSALKSLEPDIEMQRYSKGFFSNYFKNGTQAGGLLKLKNASLSREAREKIRSEFQEANSGANEAGKVLVMDETMDYKAFEINTEVLKLINTSDHSTAQVAKVFGIPLHKFGIVTSNLSFKDTMADYLQTTLSRYIKGITASFEFKLFPRSSRELSFDTEAYRKADWESYSETLSNQYNDGVITLNEYREKLGLEPVDEEYADKHRVSLNQVNAEIVDEYQMKTMDNRTKSINGSTLEGGEGIDGEGN